MIHGLFFPCAPILTSGHQRSALIAGCRIHKTLRSGQWVVQRSLPWGCCVHMVSTLHTPDDAWKITHWWESELQSKHALQPVYWPAHDWSCAGMSSVKLPDWLVSTVTEETKDILWAKGAGNVLVSSCWRSQLWQTLLAWFEVLNLLTISSICYMCLRIFQIETVETARRTYSNSSKATTLPADVKQLIINSISALACLYRSKSVRNFDGLLRFL